ncbi:hypothetical protein F2P81_004225 [Scophthalmus maximus]|uniref:Transmembrane protein 138 n=1 Tax=Scophthalmus maximus TaxID=52904 RepID=A0A6A4TEN8_SCOMX|nr:hypothetical protein F2P81_004225 [Scophthalmus maximus]
MSTSVICRQLIPNPDALSHVERTSVSPPVNGSPDAASRTPHQHLGKIGVESFEGLSRDAEIHIQDIATLFNLIIILLMLFNTYVFQVGLVAVLLERFRSLLMLSALYLTFSIILHSWLMNLRWLNTNRFIWTDGLQVLFVFQRAASVLYYYFYKRTTEYLGDPRLYEDSPWLREVFARIRQ